MKWLSKLFGREKIIEQAEKIEQGVEEEPKRIPTGDEHICEYCQQAIFGDQKVKTFQNKKYHVKPCWRKMHKEAPKMVFGQMEGSN